MTVANESLLASIRELAPAIAARAAEIEAGRRIPPDLAETLKSIGLFRMFVPKRHGGLELDLPAGLDVVTALAKVDGSVGWAAMIGSSAALLPALHPLKLYDSIYKDGPNVAFTSSATPGGSAEAVDGGWRVTGRWPFASGCQHADWIFAGCVMKENGKPLPGPAEGAPQIQFFSWPARHWRIEDTWHAAGLKGTGSHHVSIENAFIPDEHFIELTAGPCIPGPLYLSPRHFIPLFHEAVALGMAEGALDDLVEMANAGRRQFRAATTMRESEMFQGALGRIEADLRAAQAMHQVRADSLWRHAQAGTLRGDTLLIQGQQSAAWITTICVGIADGCFTLGGGAALYESSPLQRRMRDLHTAAQHVSVQQRHYASAGALLLGTPEPDSTGDPPDLESSADER